MHFPFFYLAKLSLSQSWEKWLEQYEENGIYVLIILAVVLTAGTIVALISKKNLQKYKLQRITYIAIAAIAIYLAHWIGHFDIMSDANNVIAFTFRKIFIAIMLIAAVCYIDRLLILVLLTHIFSKPPSRFVHQIIITILTIFAIATYCSWAFEFSLSSFIAGSAAISIILGLALQKTIGTFFDGMVLQASPPFKTGDWIQLGNEAGLEGRVVDTTWRAVTLVTLTNNYIHIPNSLIVNERIINYSSPSTATATAVILNLDYVLDPAAVKRVLIQAARDTDGVLTTPPPSVHLLTLADASIQYRVNFWTDFPQRRPIIEEAVRVNIWYRLNQAGMNIPFTGRATLAADLEKARLTARQAAQNTRLAALKACTLFGPLPAETLEALAAETRDFTLTPNQIFYRQSDPGNVLYILLAGTVAISLETNGTPPRILDAGEASAPFLFGQTSAFTGQPRTRTIRAKTAVRAMEITNQQLHTLLAQCPVLAQRFSDAVTQNQNQRDDFLKKYAPSASPTSETPEESDSILDRVTQFFTRFGPSD